MVDCKVTTKHAYSAGLGYVDWHEEAGSVEVRIKPCVRVTPEMLREFATLLDDVAIAVEASGGPVVAGRKDDD